MSANLSGFNAEAIPEGDDYGVLPAGEYQAMLVKSEVKETKSGNGTYLNLQWQIVGDHYKNRVFFQTVTMSNPNEEAVAIGHRGLAAICRAVGILRPQSSEDLHHKPCRVTLTVKDDNKGYGPQNRVRSVKPLNAEAETPTYQPHKPNGVPAMSGPSNGGKPPWVK